MAEYESQKIRGWRGLLEDAATEVRHRFWNAPAEVVYSRELKSPCSDNLAGNPRWFSRVFGPERQAASNELRRLRNLLARIRYTELTPEQKQERYAKSRARRAALTEEKRENERVMWRQWRARQNSDWRAKEAAKKRLRRLAKPELYQAIDRRSMERTRDARSERKRKERAANLNVVRSRDRDRYQANRERINTRRAALRIGENALKATAI